MGTTIRQRNIEVDQPSNTEQLFKWITQVRTKKIKFLRNRRRNIRVEAVLAHALSHAEQELRNKQITRINKWQELKRQMAEMEKGDKATMETLIQDGCRQATATVTDNNNGWSEKCPELSSLDSFMSQLNEIKAPVCR